MSSDCRLSLVVTTRNDNHGGDMLHRFQMFAENLLEQANTHSLSGELIVVEWNPPLGPRLHEVLKLRVKSDCFAIRFIEVPPEAHETIRNADVIPLFQMIGKNVGIRRARGEFVLATNPDILFSEDVIAFMASDKLLADVMYRIDRHDVPADVPDNVPIDKRLAWCAANVLRVHRRRGSFPPPRRFFARFRALDPALWTRNLPALWKTLERRFSSSVSFCYLFLYLRLTKLKRTAPLSLSLWYHLWYLRLVKLKRNAPASLSRWYHLWYLRLTKIKKLLDNPRHWRTLFQNLLGELLGPRGLIRRALWRLTAPLRRFGNLSRRYIQRIAARCRRFFYSPRFLIRRALWGALRLTDPLPKIHTNGCGDFTLMSRDLWFELRGYPELPLWSMHIDSLLCYMAVASRAREYTLRPPAKIYHMEHYNSWVVMTPDDRLRTFTKKPWIDIGLLSEIWENMYKTNRPIRFNKVDWGLADWLLKEIVFLSGKKQNLKQSSSQLNIMDETEYAKELQQSNHPADLLHPAASTPSRSH